MKACVLHAAQDLRVQDWNDDGTLAAGAVRIKFAVGGICGSDLHYYFEGRIGEVRVREPFVLGHEMAGDVVEVGDGVRDGVGGIAVGDRVVANPSRPCRRCRYCAAGRENLCDDMRFMGSARLLPHTQGVFQEYLSVHARQCFVVPSTLAYNKAACAEPLAVAMHAVARGGPLLGRRVLVTGSGPIGTLIVAVARRAGAGSITVTDVVDPPLAVARQVGADEAINVRTDGARMTAYAAAGGGFDVVFEASGNVAALDTCIEAARPGARIVQVGLMSDVSVPLPVNRMSAREFDYVGSFRFHQEFAWAVQYLVDGLIDVEPILSPTFNVGDIDEAFHFAADRTKSMKVHVAF